MTICSVFSRFFRNHNKVFIVMFPRMQVIKNKDPDFEKSGLYCNTVTSNFT